MDLVYAKTFPKALKLLPKHVQELVRIVLGKLEAAENLQKSGLDYTKMEGQKKAENFYRIRVGEYRIGIENINPKAIIITILHRSEIYKRFP